MYGNRTIDLYDKDYIDSILDRREQIKQRRKNLRKGSGLRERLLQMNEVQ